MRYKFVMAKMKCLFHLPFDGSSLTQMLDQRQHLLLQLQRKQQANFRRKNCPHDIRCGKRSRKRSRKRIKTSNLFNCRDQPWMHRWHQWMNQQIELWITNMSVFFLFWGKREKGFLFLLLIIFVIFPSSKWLKHYILGVNKVVWLLIGRMLSHSWGRTRQDDQSGSCCNTTFPFKVWLASQKCFVVLRFLSFSEILCWDFLECKDEE